jgi:MoxR-like ATPase
MTLVGTSNELPEGEGLDTLFDRFLLRFWVPYLTEQRNVRRLLSSGAAPVQTRITLDELAACQREVAQVVLPDALIDSCRRATARRPSRYWTTDRLGMIWAPRGYRT